VCSHIREKTFNFVMTVRLSYLPVCLQLSARLPSGRIYVKFDIGHICGDMLGNPVWLQSDTNTGTLHTDRRAFYCFLRHKFAVKGLLRDTQYFVTLLTVICNSTIHTHTIHCCLSTVTMVTRRRHSATLYVHCLPFFYLLTYLLHGTESFLRR